MNVVRLGVRGEDVDVDLFLFSLVFLLSFSCFYFLFFIPFSSCLPLRASMGSALRGGALS